MKGLPERTGGQGCHKGLIPAAVAASAAAGATRSVPGVHHRGDGLSQSQTSTLV
jgi:hypothetical protein